MTTTHGGRRKGAGRKPRSTPKGKPIYCGDMTDEARQTIKKNTTPAQRREALLRLARVHIACTDMQIMTDKENAEMNNPTYTTWTNNGATYIERTSEQGPRFDGMPFSGLNDVIRRLSMYINGDFTVDGATYESVERTRDPNVSAGEDFVAAARK